MKKYAFVLIFIILSLATGTCYGAPSVSIDATLLSKNKCTFNTSATTITFSPNLNPVNPTVRTATATLVGAFVCRGSDPTASYTITDDSGLHETAPTAFRLQHQTNLTQFIPYTFSYSPTSGSAAKNVNQNLVINVTIQPNDYQDAIQGTYSDTVTLTLAP